MASISIALLFGGGVWVCTDSADGWCRAGFLVISERMALVALDGSVVWGGSCDAATLVE